MQWKLSDGRVDEGGGMERTWLMATNNNHEKDDAENETSGRTAEMNEKKKSNFMQKKSNERMNGKWQREKKSICHAGKKQSKSTLK